MSEGVWVLLPRPASLELCLGSSCHGAGRVMSRSAARRAGNAADVIGRLRDRGILLTAASRRSVVEEMPDAYKDVEEVVEVMVRAGIVERAAHFRPLAVLKG